jgi:hypothetical protein
MLRKVSFTLHAGERPPGYPPYADTQTFALKQLTSAFGPVQLLAGHRYWADEGELKGGVFTEFSVWLDPYTRQLSTFCDLASMAALRNGQYDVEIVIDDGDRVCIELMDLSEDDQ